MTFDRFDVVVTPFPFADRATVVARPGVILSDWASFGSHTGVALVAMVTSARHSAWPMDVPVADLAAAGLSVPCLVRMKLNSIDASLMERRIGRLADVDAAAVKVALSHLLPGT